MIILVMTFRLSKYTLKKTKGFSSALSKYACPEQVLEYAYYF